MSTSEKPTSTYQRVIVTLPHDLAEDIQKYADIIRRGNKSGFVADALKAYIRNLRDTRHTLKLRDAYKASASLGKKVNKEWEHLDNEAWEQLDRLAPPSIE